MANSNRSGKRRSGTLEILNRYGLEPTYPLSPHTASGRWYKTVRGRRYYFGPLEDPEAALESWLDVADELKAGLEPRAWREPIESAQTPRGIRNAWLESLEEDVDAGVIKPRTLAGYAAESGKVAEGLPDVQVDRLRPDDFARLANALRGKHSPTIVKKLVGVGKMMFSWAEDAEVIEAQPKYGKRFRGPTKKERREAEREAGDKIYNVSQLGTVLEAARCGREGSGGRPGVRPSAGLYAASLLALNGGFTQKEVSELRADEVDLKAGVIDMLRGKTGVRRIVPLWPETVAAVELAIQHQPQPSHPEAVGLLLLTRTGQPWVLESLNRVEKDGKIYLRPSRKDSLGQAWSDVCASVGVSVKGAGFGKLRRTHRTVTDRARDTTAARCVMGQAPQGIDEHYVRTLGRDQLDDFLPRLYAVTDLVRLWLWPDLASQAADVVAKIG